MAVDPSVLTRIMGANAPAASTRNNRLTQMLAGAGAAMSQVSRPGMGPGASFGEVLGAGAQGMLQGQQAAQQQERQAQLMQMREMQMQQQRQEMERRTRQQELLQRMIGGTEARLERNPLAMEGGPQFQMQPGQESMVGNLPPQAQQLLAAMAPEQQMQYLVQNSALAPRIETLSSEEVEGLGLPEGSLVQRDPRNGGLQVLREGFDMDSFRQQARVKAQIAREFAGPSISVRDEKALNLMEQGLPRHEAYNVVDGIIDYEINEKTGKIIYTNAATGEVREVPLGGAPEVAPQEGPTIWSLNDEGDVTGPGSTIKAVGNVVAGLFGGNWGAKETQARQTVAASTQNLLRALSNNPRYPVGEMERLREEVNLTPSMFDSESAFRNRMIGVDNALRQRLQNELRVANDPNSPESMRVGAVQAANDIQNYLRQMGVPEGARMGSGGGGSAGSTRANQAQRSEDSNRARRESDAELEELLNLYGG